MRVFPLPPLVRLLLAALAAAGAAAVVGAAVTPPPDARAHWAFQAPREVRPPAVRDVRWPRTDVDRFILAALEGAGRRPAPAADRRTLIRRVTFDLHGLPPTPAEVAAFAADPGPDAGALARLVDRLLDSPRYGERWGRHWLDVARYSDTKGYVYSREERRFVHAFAYRDWVIRALNEDLRYDRFLLLQLAADQLVPGDAPDLAAMGFLTGGRRFIGVTHDIIDDRIDVVTRGAMALTVQCARCHDHKYDPVPTRDYYSLYGVFHGCDDRLVPLAPADDKVLRERMQKLAETMAKRRAEAAGRLRARVGDYLTAQFELEKYPEEGFDQILGKDDLIPNSVRRWRDYLHTTRDEGHPIFGPWHRLAGVPSTNFAAAAAPALAAWRGGPGANPLVADALAAGPGSPRELAAAYGRAFARAEDGRDTNAPGAAELRAFLREPDGPAVVPDTGIVNNEMFFITAAVEELWKLQGDVERRLIELGTPAALVLADRGPEPNPRVFQRGSPARPGEVVPRQFLEVLAGSDRRPFTRGSGRLELARAIASPDNPLTARVLVNRVWQHHFGSGLVRTPSDFGLRAEPPSHPELLDWLARRFMADGWSLKALHRLILGSAVYQQASAAGQRGRGEEAAVLDPDHRLLGSYPVRRLEFEAVRDAMLAVSGELDPTMGGKPAGLLEPENRRRTVYGLVDRQFLPGVLRTFDFANPDIHVPVRHETTVPQQALFFLNGPFAAARAQALARRFAGEPPERRVQQLHQALYQRPASRTEVRAALRFIEAAQAGIPASPPPPRPTPWRYGTGEVDEGAGRLKGFTPLPHFTGSSWQGAAALPGGATGWAQLTAEGGHPGNTRALACVRRWVAPRDATVDILGSLRHEAEPGDGVRAFVLSSRQGLLKSATVHRGRAELALTGVMVRAGDTLDFVVDIGSVLNSDDFLWAPVVASRETTWDARAEFAGPPPAAALLLGPWEQYAQVLLLANEFAFVD